MSADGFMTWLPDRFTGWLREYWQAELEAADLTRRSARETNPASHAGEGAYQTAKSTLAGLAAAQADVGAAARSRRQRRGLLRRWEERASLGLRVQTALELENPTTHHDQAHPGSVAARLATIGDRVDHAQQRAWVRRAHRQPEGRAERER